MTKSKQNNRVRIIAGKFRGRLIEFEDHVGLRPTPDRVRETLFNWLQNDIVGSDCLDLFAGSGVLSFEAISRGANSVTAIDSNHSIVGQLQNQRANLKIDAMQILNVDAIRYLQQPDDSKKFDIIFVDPPYDKYDLSVILNEVAKSQLLKPNSKIYFESNRELDQDLLDPNWQIIKSKKAGQVYYYLANASA